MITDQQFHLVFDCQKIFKALMNALARPGQIFNTKESIDKIEGASAKVSLKTETAVVSYDRVLDDVQLKRAVEKAGFSVVSIEG